MDIHYQQKLNGNWSRILCRPKTFGRERGAISVAITIPINVWTRFKSWTAISIHFWVTLRGFAEMPTIRPNPWPRNAPTRLASTTWPEAFGSGRLIGKAARFPKSTVHTVMLWRPIAFVEAEHGQVTLPISDPRTVPVTIRAIVLQRLGFAFVKDIKSSCNISFWYVLDKGKPIAPVVVPMGFVAQMKDGNRKFWSVIYLRDTLSFQEIITKEECLFLCHLQ